MVKRDAGVDLGQKLQLTMTADCKCLLVLLEELWEELACLNQKV